MSLVWLKAVPWSTLLANAPVIVDGAKKLAALVRKQPAVASKPAAGTFAGGAPSDLGALQERIEQLEEEQRQTAELLRSMAESHAQMTQALIALRARARLNLRLAVVALLGLSGLLVWLALR
jgi:hypothetical protein